MRRFARWAGFVGVPALFAAGALAVLAWPFRPPPDPHTRIEEERVALVKERLGELRWLTTVLIPPFFLVLEFWLAFTRGAWPRAGFLSPLPFLTMFGGLACCIGFCVGLFCLGPWWLCCVSPLVFLVLIVVDLGIMEFGYWVGGLLADP
jgi:hypothetical protein